ncbi:hypothetical protein CU048_12160 [Beijerinckiaceae bacterium]|jgi:hypothetical protein|nr:hypothetical protein CU048_12160 [Beijerinckiaceae bacterium]
MSTIPMTCSTFRFLLVALSLLTASTVHADNSHAAACFNTAQLSPPRVETLPPPENQRCANYAHGAVSDYSTMRRFQQCFLPDNPRWQADYRNHYQWCLTARPEWLASETKARTDHLVHCGVRKSF